MVFGRTDNMNDGPSPEVEKTCICDGQFSESDMCRKHSGDLGFLRFSSTTHPGICPGLSAGRNISFPHLTSGFFFEDPKTKIYFPCEDPNYRGLLLILQAGPWFRRQNNWKEAIVRWFADHFEHEQFQRCRRYNKVDVIWLGYATSQSPTMQGAYPTQEISAILEFNEFCRSYLQTMPFPVTILDWANLTLGSQTSDGFHGLAEVNLVKAYHIMNVAKFLRPQE